MDGTEGQKDTLPQGQSPTGDAQGTSEKPKQTPKTYTESDVQKAVNDALAAKGRDAKTLAEKEASLNALQEEINAAKAQIAEFERQKDEAELEEARRDPSRMVEYQQKKNYRKLLQDLDNERRQLKQQQEALKQAQAEHEAEVNQARQTMMEVKIWEIGAKYEVDPALLKDLNLPTVEAVETVARKLGKVKQPTPEDAEAAAKEFTPDSGVTSGGGQPTPEQLEKMTPEQYAAHRKKQDPSLI